MKVNGYEINVDVPDGYEFVRYGRPKTGERYVTKGGYIGCCSNQHSHTKYKTIVKKKKETWRSYTIQINNGTEAQDELVEKYLGEVIEKLGNFGIDVCENEVFNDSGEI